ncbi:MAG: NAD(P)-dependent glycerol-3-phosphate dehydrogenase [Burkholderiales bacterium]|nr:NAD(P)-dependent glycerol-3-phosphate dehydrogenase [Burkholderiales bacterium]
MKIAVLGAGAWGTALAINLAGRRAVSLWARDAEQLRAMAAARVNRRYLPDCAFPGGLAVEPDLSRAVEGSAYVVVAVTVSGLRATLRRLRELKVAVPVIWLCKGFERPDARLPHEVYAEEMGDRPPGAVLSGPSFAQEVAAGLPAALTLAAADAALAAAAAQALHGPALRVYSHDDVIGVEVGGAVKNVIAIAAGVCDGLGLGLNARAALITRGLAEMTRLGIALGGRAETFTGLAGIGDLLLTCTGDLSRNRRVGLALARGEAAASAQAGLGHVAEGVFTAGEVSRRAAALGVDMPITDAVCRVLAQPGSAADIVRSLLARDPKPEHAALPRKSG